MRHGRRDLWIEIAALGIAILSLLGFLLAFFWIGTFWIVEMLQKPVTLSAGPAEKLIAILVGLVPGTALALIGVGLRLLLSGADEPG